MKFRFSFCTLIFLTGMYSAVPYPWTEFALGENALTPVKASGETILTATADKVRASISIETHILNFGVPQDRPPQEQTSNCTYSRYPCSLVDRIDFSINGKSVFVARSVFADLADIDGARLTGNGRDFILSLECGDAAEAYYVKIRFNSTQVLDRTISDPGTGYVFQETKYSPPEIFN